MTTNSNSVSALEAIGISINDVEGNVKSASTVITELQGKWNDLSDAQRQQTAVGVAGIYQLSRFNALMLNAEMGAEATTTAITSQGSAMREQLTYSESLEARINRLKNSWTGLAATAGDSILYDGIVLVTEGLKGATNAGEGLIGKLGILGPLFGTIATAAVFFSGTLRGIVVQKTLATQAAIAQAVATRGLSTAMATASVAGAAMATAFKSLLIATGVGVGFLAVGFALEKLTSAISANIQEQEKIDTYIRQNSEALTTNKETVDGLISEYNRLTQAKANDSTWDSTKEQEYLHVQQQLGDFFPALVDSIDATGQAHIKSAEDIEVEIDALERLIEAENKVTVANAAKEFDKLQDKLKGGAFSSFENFINRSLESQIKGTKDIIDALKKQGNDDLATEYEAKLIQLEMQYAETAKAIQAHIFTVAQASNDLAVSDSVAKSVNAFITSLDTSKLDPSKLQDFSKELGSVQDQFQKAVDTDSSKVYDDAVKSLNKLAKEYNLTEDEVQNFVTGYDDFIKALSNGNAVAVEGETVLDEFGNVVGSTAQAVSQYASTVEALAMVSKEQTEATAELTYKYNALSEQLGNLSAEELINLNSKEQLTSQEQELLITLNQLNALYPTLLDADGKITDSTFKKIKAIEQETKSNQILLDAYEESTYAKLTGDQKAVLSSASRTKGVIDNIKAEISALNVLQQALQATYNEQAKLATQKELDKVIEKYGKDSNEYRNFGAGAYRAGTVLGQTQSQITDYSAQLDTLRNNLTTSTDKISGFIAENDKASSSTKKSTSATDKNNSSTQQSIYLADKYKQTLEELALAIQKQIALREKLPETSADFTKSIEYQLKLEEQKLAVMKQQEKSIQSQVKTGNIQQTGVVKQDTTSTIKPSGFQGTITSSYGNRTFNGKTEFHRGTDIASPLGTRLDAFQGGKVVASGNASSQGYHSSYGNIVVVQSDDGTKRLYAHLQETLVKVGQQIEAGTQIGKVGSTGNSTGSHLHYELYQNGKLVDSGNEVAQARNGITVSAGGSSEVVNGAQQSIDEAKSDLLGIQSDILNQEQAINDLRKTLVDSVLTGYEFRKSNYDKFLENSENRLNKVSKSSEDYRKELDKQVEALNAKKKVNQDEINALKGFIDSGTLTQKVVAEYTDKLHELGKVNSDIDLTLKGIEESKLESYIELVNELTTKYNTLRDKIEGTVNYENALLQGLNTGSEKYSKTLERINSALKEKQAINKQELTSLADLINTGGLYGEALDNARKRLQELRTEIVQLQFDIQEGNFEILINIKNKADEKVDDFQFEIDRAEALRKLQVEGSADYKKYTTDLIKQQELIAQSHLATRDALQAELKVSDITVERKKEILELIESEHLAYLNATLAVKDYTKQLEESNKAQLEQIANDVVNASKAAYQARRDDHIKLIDEELKREEEAHNKRVKQLNDEMNLFRKNVEERLELINRQEAERGYNEEIDELEKERNKVQQDIDLLALDDSNEAKSKRKKLQEQLDKIDKDIAQKRHDRDIELQKQGLEDLLESKEQEIDGKLELEDEEYQAVVDRINREKEYWEKHYTDLINDERKFAKLREEILAGNFANVEKEFAEHIQYLKDSLPGFEDTLDGTMQAVGTSIRQNLIDQLQLAITKIGEFQQASSDLNLGSGFNDGGFNPNTDKDSILNDSNNSSSSSSNTSQPSKISTTEADIKVLVGKYLNEVVLGQTKDSNLRASIKSKGDSIAAQGRSEGSKIASNSSFSSIFGTLDSSSRTKLRGALNAQANAIGDDSLKNFIKSNISSLNTGGMLRTNGNGFDGIGGKFFLGHDGEVVNSPLETKQLLDTVNSSNSLFDKLRSVISPVINSLPNFNGFNNQSSLGDTIEVHLNGNFGSVKKSDGRELGEMIGNAILTKKGGNW